MHSLRATATYPYVEVYQSSDIEVAGRPYGLCLANLAALDDPVHAAWTTTEEQERQVSHVIPNRLPYMIVYDSMNMS